MKQQQIYRKIDQEHPRYSRNDETSQVSEYFSPQERLIKENILIKTFLQQNFDIENPHECRIPFYTYTTKH